MNWLKSVKKNLTWRINDKVCISLPQQTKFQLLKVSNFLDHTDQKTQVSTPDVQTGTNKEVVCQ